MKSQLPPFDNEKLLIYVQNEYTKIVNQYLKKIYENIPDLEIARKSLNYDLDIPTVDTPNDAARFNLYNLSQELHEMYERLPKVLDRLYKDEPEIRGLFPDLLKYQKLAKKLYQDLQDDNLLAKVLELQKNDKLRTHLWSTTIINVTNQFGLQPGKLVQIIDEKTIVIRWPIMVYSYLRDFELFFRYVVDPTIEYDPLNSNQERKYIERFRDFCQTSGKMTFYSETLKSVLKTSVRNRLAHQQYYVKMSTEEIILFHDENFPKGKDKVITYSDMLNLTIGMNTLLWSALLFIFDGWSIEIDKDIQEGFLQKYALYYDPILIKNQTELQSLNSFNKEKLRNYLKEYMNNSPESDTILPFPIIESYHYHMLLFKKIKPNQFELMDIQARSQYLVGYALLEEKYLKPLAKTLDPRIHLGYVKDKKLLEIVNSYKESKYQELFEVFNPTVRNAIAHVHYYRKGILSHYLDPESQELKPLAIGFLNAFSIYSDLDDVFNISKEKVALLFGIAKFLNNVYFDGTNLNASEYEIAGETIFKLDSEKYESLYPFGMVCLSISALLTNSKKDIRKSILDLSKIIRKEDIDPSIVYGSIVLFAFKHHPEQAIPWLNYTIQYLSIQPQNTHEKQLLWFFKSLVYLFNNDVTKARETYNRALKI